MNIAITQRETIINEIVHDCLDPAWYQFLNGHTIFPVPNLGYYDFTNIDCLIISGGDDTTNRLSTETNCIGAALEKKIPIIGICHGAFAINRISGGTNTIILGHHNVNHPIYLDGITQTVNSYHTIAIQTLGSNLTTLATDSNGIVEAFVDHTQNIWGIVWHPERMGTPVLPGHLKELLCLSY